MFRNFNDEQLKRVSDPVAFKKSFHIYRSGWIVVTNEKVFYQQVDSITERSDRSTYSDTRLRLAILKARTADLVHNDSRDAIHIVCEKFAGSGFGADEHQYVVSELIHT